VVVMPSVCTIRKCAYRTHSVVFGVPYFGVPHFGVPHFGVPHFCSVLWNAF